MKESSLEYDAKLVRETLSGSKNAFKLLMKKYTRIAASLAYSIVGDFHIAADVVQESFTKMYFLLSSLDNPKSFSAYLSNTVRSSATDFIRKKNALRRGKPVSLSDAGEQINNINWKNDNSSKSTKGSFTSEGYGKLLELINHLPEHYRDVFILKHVEDMSYEDIGRILDLTKSQVESRLFRTRKLLRENLDGQNK